MSKIHYSLQPEPVRFEDYEAIRAECDAEVRKPHVVEYRDLNWKDLPVLNSLNDCHKCWQLVFKAALAEERYYLYGLLDGESWMERRRIREGALNCEEVGAE